MFNKIMYPLYTRRRTNPTLVPE